MQYRFESFVTGITECYRYIQRIKSAEMTELGLKGTHVMCLYYLGHSTEGLTAAQLCSACAEDKAAVSRTLAELERREFVRPAAPDGKKYRARMVLTERGRQTVLCIDRLVTQWVTLGGDGLTEDERVAFYATLGRIAANLREKVEKGL